MSRLLLGPGLAAACLGCATTEVVPPAVADVYRLYAQHDCPTVQRIADQSTADAGQEWVRLLGAYCLELAGDTVAAQEVYSSIVAAGPRTDAAHEASFRLRDIDRLERSGSSRAQRKERALHRAGRGPPAPPAIERARAIYPDPASAAELDGWVQLDFAIRGDGTVTDAVVLESDPPFVFDRAAVAAVGQWTFAPPARPEELRKIMRFVFRSFEASAIPDETYR